MLTVKDLRAALDGLPDETPVCYQGGDWGWQQAHSADVATIEWHTDEDGEELDDDKLFDVRCLTIE